VILILIQISLVTYLEVMSESNEVPHRGLEQLSKTQDKSQQNVMLLPRGP